MSLLNDVLRDLQTRGVFGVPPLAGLEPVAEIPAHQRKRALLLPIAAGVLVAATIVMWKPVADGQWLPLFERAPDDVSMRPQAAAQSGLNTETQLEPPAVAATGNDLRELFSVENTVEPGATAQSEFVVDTVTDAPAAAAIAADLQPRTESPDVVEAPAATASTVIADPTPQAAPAAVVESRPAPASAQPQPATRTNIRRSQPGADDVQGIVARALKAMRSNDLFTAESMFRAALVIESGDVEIWGYLYSVLVRTSRPAAAEQVLQQGLVAADEPAALAKLYARMLLDRGDKDAAVSILKIHRPPAAADIEYDSFLAALLQQQGKYAEAGDVYESLLTVDPASSSHWIGLAMSHDSLGARADALAAFERALSTGSLKPPLARYARRRSTELKADD